MKRKGQPAMRRGDELSIGYFSDFAEPTLLIWGASRALMRFADLLRDLPDHQGRPVSLSDLPWLTLVRSTNILLHTVKEGSEIRRLGEESRNLFRLATSTKRADEFAAMIASVAEAEKPCHAYLDFDSSDGMTVVVSKGEYPHAWPVDC